MYWVSIFWECWFTKTISAWCHDKEGNLITYSRNIIVRSIEKLIKKNPLILALKKLGRYINSRYTLNITISLEIRITSKSCNSKGIDMIKRLMYYPKCRSVKVINNPARLGSNHREVNYIKLQIKRCWRELLRCDIDVRNKQG